jgi:putative tricarboxylic transport membrane protein
MSEGAGTGGVRQHAGGMPHHHRVAIAFFLLALLGPALAVLFGKPADLYPRMASGWFSVPMAVFGVCALFLPLRNPRDFFGGALLVGLGLFAMWASSDLPGMRGFAFGPGTAPRLFAWGLIILGVAVTLVGLFTDGPPEEPYAFSGPLGGAVLIVALIPITYYSNRIGRMVTGVPPDIIVAALGATVVLGLAFLLQRVAPRGPLFITAATLIFAITVRPLGLVFASFVSLMVSGYATHEIRWLEMTIWAIVLTIFCSLLFPWGLNLPLQLWPRF